MKLFAGVFLAMGIYMSLFVVHGLWKLHESKDWKKTNGVVISGRLLGSGELVVEYTYTVNGEEYSNNREFFGWVGESKHGMTGTNGVLYKAGRNVSVYYDSDSPQDSVLDLNTHRGIYEPLPWILFFVLFGIYGVFIHQEKKT